MELSWRSISASFCPSSIVEWHKKYPVASVQAGDNSTSKLRRLLHHRQHGQWNPDQSLALRFHLLLHHTGLATVLDAHAPMVYRSFAVRPDNPWCSEEILAARRRLRRLERLWRRTGLHVHYEMFNDACLSRNKLIHEAKSTFLVSRINENLEKKSLFKVVDSFLIKKPQLALPNHDSLPELAERFSAFFTEKVNNIRVALEVLACNVVRDFAPYRGNSFSVFKPLYQSFRANEQNAVYSTLSAAISEIKCWLSQNFLKLNEEKTDVILLSSASSKHPPEGTSLDVGGALVPISDGVPSRLKSYGNRAFSVFAPRLWNSLPLSIRSAQSLGQFRSLLKTHLFSTAFSN
ncbi:hypothetical protein DAPPUDRAFT_121530 [Daphnia pulex]|uniref:Uncharacterized protein n=1 Tax=Daphnia pulex TaxID=6669 RepID=E9I391_DAPPU|nr:hypothetical protein DAPPUDRAFT_121530 [Daphnia pulex]|eukprot:EFX61540.1 hypothetical protein DAPPUDRAFT_121530 [Daphnia pulex]